MRGYKRTWINAPRLIVGAAAVLLLPTIPAAVSSAAPAAPALGGKLSNVIIVLRDQHNTLKAKGKNSPRALANRADQAGVIAFARANGVGSLHGYNNVNEMSATVTPAQQQALAADPAVAAVFPDLNVAEAPRPPAQKSVASANGSARRPKASKNGAQPDVDTTSICPADPSHPMLEPEALQLTKTAFDDPGTPSAQATGINGSGVLVAFIADGLDINNPDFIRQNTSHVFVDYQDFSGDGTDAITGGGEAFGDASSIAAQGRQSYDLSNFVNPLYPLPAGCNIRVEGVAPGVSLVGLKAFGNEPFAPSSHLIAAIDYAIGDGVSVLNQSFGGNPFPDTGTDPITLADQAAVAAGITVVASTGDSGTAGTIASAASNNGIIGVGATTQFRSYDQRFFGGFMFSNGNWDSNNISAISSAGVSAAGKVPDLVAPGDLGWALCTPDLSLYTECGNDNNNAPSPIQDFGGTSESAPLVSGAAALVIETYAVTHGGQAPTPQQVKQILTSTATDLTEPASEQGAGLLNSLGAVLAAADMPGGDVGDSNALVADKTQVFLNGAPNKKLTSTVTLTNLSDSAQTVTAATRAFTNVVSTANDSFTLDTGTAPNFDDNFGQTDSYIERSFTVGASVDHLDVSFADQDAMQYPLFLTLLDPSGTFVAHSLPQGHGNFGNVDVRAPAEGTWTALFYTAQATGFNGTVADTVTQTKTAPYGTVTPASQSIAAGGTATFTITDKLPKNAGDLPTSVEFTGSGGGTLSVPVTLRSDLTTSSKGFPGTITGGNGRGIAQSNVYYVNVPKNKKALGVNVTLTDPQVTVVATLTAPDGQTFAFQTNVINGATGNALQLYHNNPDPGLWQVGLFVLNPISGLETSQQFTIKASFSPVKVKAKLPKSPKTMLAAGVAVSIPVTITNTGNELLSYFLDPRLTTTGDIDLADVSGNNSMAPLPFNGTQPNWFLPSNTGTLTVQATGDHPIDLNTFFQGGNPSLYATSDPSNKAVATETAPEVTPGLWSATGSEIGPFATPPPAGTVSYSASVTGRLFDPAITTPGGDGFHFGVVGDPGGETPVPIDPGQSATIDVSITPSGAPGTIVTGTLFVDTFDFTSFSGMQLMGIPYSYTIK
jgi:hypothetical protein